jgi:hypothetical protein
MKLTRHNLLMVGLLLFFAGVQFRMVESFTLNERSSRFVAARLGNGGDFPQSVWQTSPGSKMVQPPRWLGLALMSVGSVLTLKSLSMKGIWTGPAV